VVPSPHHTPPPSPLTDDAVSKPPKALGGGKPSES